MALDSQQLTSPSQQAVTQLESSIAKGKKEFKELKDTTNKLMTEVVLFINLVAEADGKLQKERENLQHLVSDANEQLAKMFEIEQSIQELERKNGEVISINDKLASSIEWYQPYIRMVEKLQAVRLRDMTANEVTFDLSVANVTHAVSLRLDPARKSITSIQINPAPVQLEHLAQDMSEAREMASLVEEMTFALTNHYKREREIKEVSQHYQIRRMAGVPSSLTIEVSLSTGHVCTIKFDNDYPLHPTGAIRLISVQRQGQAIGSDQLTSIHTQVHRPDCKYDLAQLIQHLIGLLQNS
ncbi:hypothetical protein SAMD00019534_070410 [Acytostelium subglobosum LB1]|uniref:hypothetical protein n=1 Tax=Acytostelium subglobosum LB1 TaxID=1410327 RepID=UPI000644A9BF|nr:hypothetical protein SAMD00019534_070410 [Acytostelium subglobosum LB1]GAM23866.1 hypothetical protein SAMD00019534_070410 [Acytostelium subglobosum LB1]|eukprot:XP_012752902.1 hypothetical protein SAMD00019534_070410 [Acytostelium subglobosum LB1]